MTLGELNKWLHDNVEPESCKSDCNYCNDPEAALRLAGKCANISPGIVINARFLKKKLVWTAHTVGFQNQAVSFQSETFEIAIARMAYALFGGGK